MAFRTTFGVLVFVALGAAATAGMVTIAHTLATRQPPRAASLMPPLNYPAPNADAKTNRLPVTLVSYAPAPTPSASQPSAVNQYAAVDPAGSAIPGKLPDDMMRNVAKGVRSTAPTPAATAPPPRRRTT